MGVACAGRWRGPFRSMWTQTSKKNFEKNLKIFREVTPGSPSPRKPHINTGIRSNKLPLNQQPLWGGFGVMLIRRVSGDPVRMESIFSFQAGGAGGGSPRISFSNKYSSMMLLLILVAFVIFTFSFIRKKTAS